MEKILIIGGTGTISSPITKQLAEDGKYEVFVLNRGNRNEGLPGNITHLYGDIQNISSIRELMEGREFDSVLNFIIRDKQAAINSIEIFKGKTKQFVYISTVCVLDHETQCNISEEVELGNEYSEYGHNKAEAEEVLLEAWRNCGFPVTIVRPTQTYSEQRIPLSVKGKGCWSVVSRMIRGKEVIIHGEGQSVWASTHADDFANGFCGLITNSATIGETYQIMNPEPHTWDMIYQELARLLNVEYKPVYIGTDLLKHSRKYDFMTSIQGDKRWSNIFNISKIKKIVPGFECHIDYKTGLKMYLDYMEKHPEHKLEEPDFEDWCDRTITLYKQLTAEFTERI
jgi:nucleoside-diphosphate-sugar epimerase